jgi:DNA-binding NarL/FixJ family response regulator
MGGRRTKPDVLLFDAGQQPLHSLALIQEVRGRHPALPVLVYCNDSSPAVAQLLLAIGVKGYVCKQDSPEMLAL